MSRPSLALLIALAPLPAAAHPGHLAEAAGHAHWLGAAALGAALAIGLRKGLRKQPETTDEAEQAEAEAQPQEA